MFINGGDGVPQLEKIFSWGLGGDNSLLSKGHLTLEHHLVVIIHGVHLLNLLCQKYPHKPEGNSSCAAFLLPPSERSDV